MSEDQVLSEALGLIHREYRRRGKHDATLKRPPRHLDGPYFDGYQEVLVEQGREDPWPALEDLKSPG